jgi:hypothetical protein
MPQSFEGFEYLLFRIALLIVFVVALVRFIRSELKLQLCTAMRTAKLPRLTRLESCLAAFSFRRHRSQRAIACNGRWQPWQSRDRRQRVFCKLKGPLKALWNESHQPPHLVKHCSEMA